MANNRIFRIFASIMFIMVFLTSSFDIVGNVIVHGFTVRAVYLFVLMGIVLTAIFWIKEKKIALPEGILFLGIWALLIFAFIPNTPLIIRNLGYAGWLTLNIGIIFTAVTLINKDNLDDMMKLYVLSFFALSVFGIVQYITPQIGLPPLFIQQWWVHPILPRVNGFNYEPSYYATYLLFGLPMTILMAARNKTAGLKNWFIYLIIAVEVVSLMLCSSRIGIVVFFVFLFGILVYGVIKQIKNKKMSANISLAFLVPFLAMMISMFWMDARMKTITTDPAYSIYFRDTGIGEDDITSGNSFKARIGAMINTFEVFQKNPIIGVSLGGIAPWIATMEGKPATSNQEVKPYEGINVLLEVLAASGVFGFAVFLIYLFLITRHLFIKYPVPEDKDYYLALLFGFFVGSVMLLENQNILRPYVWVHIAMMSAALKILKGTKAPSPAKV